jgi:hypothetical protein
LRHLQQKKINLAEEKLAEMDTLPQSRQADRPAFLAALRYMISTLKGARDAAAANRAEVERVLGSKAAAALLICGVANASKRGGFETLPAVNTLGKTELAALPEAVIRVAELAEDMQMEQRIPAEWLTETAKQFPRNNQSLSVGQLRSLAQVGLSAGHFQLAYAVSVAGLERGGPTQASFLLLRALSLPPYFEERRTVCALAAMQLARQQRQMEVVEKAVEMLAESDLEDLPFTDEQAAAVLLKEKPARAFPTANRPGPSYSDLAGPSSCNCPDCRRARGEAVNPFEDPDEGDDDFSLDDLFNETEIPPDMPPEIAQVLFAETKKAVQRGESLDSLLNRVFGPETGFGKRRKKGRRR